MKTLLHPVYLPNILAFATIVQNEVQWEVEDNFQKQTYRNRSFICTDRGRLMLSIPIQHIGKDQGRQKYCDVRLDNEYKWQRQHWRTLQTAYRTSPFFEFYEDEIAPLYEQAYVYLLDYNLKCIEIICDCLQIEMPNEKTNEFSIKPPAIEDFRFLVDAKKELIFDQEKYIQVFGDRHGFIKNVSVLDVLFNEGTSALDYLRNINTSLLNA